MVEVLIDTLPGDVSADGYELLGGFPCLWMAHLVQLNSSTAEVSNEDLIVNEGNFLVKLKKCSAAGCGGVGWVGRYRIKEVDEMICDD